MGKKELQVAAIENGTVIDHIPSEKTYEVARLLHLTDIDVPTLIGYNLPSKRLGKKGIIKITNKYFTDEEISRLSVIAPNVVYEVVEKKMVVTPNELHGIIKCNNPKCITNNEPMDTFFTVIDKEKGIVKCHYCDKEQDINNVELV